MLASEDTLKRIRAEALSYADGKTTELELFYSAIAALPREDRARVATALRAAYLAGADAGYTAAKAEGREP